MHRWSPFPPLHPTARSFHCEENEHTERLESTFLVDHLSGTAQGPLSAGTIIFLRPGALPLLWKGVLFAHGRQTIRKDSCDEIRGEHFRVLGIKSHPLLEQLPDEM